MTESILKIRPAGQLIRQVVAVVDAIGPSTYRQVHAHTQGIDSTNVNKYLSRATGLGLLTTDRSVFPRTFAAVEGWSALLERHHTTRATAQREKAQAKQVRYSSVWHMADCMSA